MSWEQDEVVEATPKAMWEQDEVVTETLARQELPANQEKFTRQFMSQWEGGSEEGEAEAKKAWEREQTNRAPAAGKTLKQGQRTGVLQYVPQARAAQGIAEAVGGQVEEFWNTLTKDSLKTIMQNGIKGMVAKGLGRKYEEAMDERLPESMRKVPVPEGYRLPTKEEFESGVVDRRDEYIPITPEKGLYDTIGEIAKHFKTNPGVTAAELLKGVAADPELLIPIVGKAAAPAKAANILARLRAVAAVGVEGASWGAAAAGAEQFAKGEYDTNKVIAGAAIGGGAALGLMGMLQVAKFKKAIPDAELEAGSISAETTRKLMKDLQGEGKVEVVPTREAAEAAGMEVVGIRPDGFIAEHTPTSIKLAVDADLRVTQQASDLMSGIRRNYKTGEVIERGVTFSEAEVLRAREANPALAKKMDEIAEMRQVERAYWEAKQWAEEQVSPQERLARRREVEGLQKTQEQFDLEEAQRSFGQEMQGTVPNELILEPASKTRLPQELIYDPAKGRFLEPEVAGKPLPKPEETLATAAEKIARGQEATMTAVERTLWNKTKVEFESVPEMRGLSEAQIAERVAMREAPVPQTKGDSSGVLLEFDPQTGSLRVATPEAPQVGDIIGKDIPLTTLESATRKMEQGRPWDMTLAEKAVWEKAGKKIARQGGKADPRLLLGVAAGAGLGLYALSNPDAMKDLTEGDGAGLAMMVGMLGVTGGKGAGRISRILASDAAKTVARSAGEVAKVMDGVLGETSTRIQNISPRIYGRLSEFFRNTQAKTHTIGLDVHPFTKAVMKVDGEGGARLLEAFKQADAGEVGRLLDKHAPELKGEWQTYQRAMRDVGEELVKAGVLSELRPDWTVPRVVKDYAGLVDAMGLEMKDAFTRAMKNAEVAAQKAGRGGLNDLERAIVADQFLQGRAPRGQGKPGFAKERVFGEGKIPQELLPFYHDLGEATNIYLNQAIRAVELRKLFGKDAQFKTDVRGRKVLDLDSSIDSLGKAAQEDLAAGRMTTAQMDELKGLVAGALDNRSMHWALQDFRNMSYMMTTGNLGTAITQLGDLPVSVVMNGLKPTLRAFTERVRGRSKLTWEDMGGVDRIAEEFVGRDRPTQRALNKIHEWAQVIRMDTVAKDTYINAAFDRLEGQVRSPAGEARFMQKYEPIFGKKEAELALQDFQKGIVSDSTKMVVFSELAEVQPITRMEMPSWAAKNPNARVLMMLKSYTLKQIDLVRRQGVAKITEGFAKNDKALAQEGMKFLGKYAIMMGLGGAGVQQLKSLIFSGSLEDMDAGDIALNAFKTMGYNEFMREKWRQGKKVESVMDTALPPYQAWNTLMKADRDSVKSLPVVGKVFHSWLLGGAEIARAQRVRRKALEKRREQPGYEERMERLREARRARLIAEGRSAR